MEQFYKDAYEEGKKVNLLIEPEDQLNVAINLLGMVEQTYEEFSHEILQFYRHYNNPVPSFIKRVNSDNLIEFGMYFVTGLLSE
ncbi:hypothetical protein [Lentibacillus cibarius]|uniref:Uncharacterized protein n=1 Tax=Lentibacillus cibarius TaxID=2583219 RepID=A0A5S3QJ46_9BACI|nr:hypothetical protein [Lentibacillus cibarius]TMN21885.1 hypothetical protein FFL34_06975 [Lentibacillus cibarius]